MCSFGTAEDVQISTAVQLQFESISCRIRKKFNPFQLCGEMTVDPVAGFAVFQQPVFFLRQMDEFSIEFQLLSRNIVERNKKSTVRDFNFERSQFQSKSIWIFPSGFNAIF